MPEKRKMEYKTYLFDFDYTLADSSRGIVICFRNVLTRHGHTDITDESIKRTIGKTLEDSFSILTGITDKNTLISYKKEYVKEADRQYQVLPRNRCSAESPEKERSPNWYHLHQISLPHP